MKVSPTITATRPDGWFHKETITLLAPDGQANVIASGEPLDPTITATQYALIQGDLLRNDFPGYLEHTFEALTVFGGLDGYLRDFSWAPPDGVPVRQLQQYAVQDGRGFTATATVPATQYDRFRGQLRAVLASLTLR
jgi:hypothetical protein